MKTFNLLKVSQLLYTLLFVMGLLSFILAMGGCKGSSPKLQTVVAEQGSVDTPAEMKVVNKTPMVDMVFIMDYSTSMFRHQKLFAQNIKHYVSAFAQHQNIDFHIAVLPIYDTDHFAASSSGRHIMNPRFPLGEFLALKDPFTPPCNYNLDPICKNSSVLAGPRFIHRGTPEYVTVLERTMLMGEEPGPAHEESFSPLFPALTGKVLVQTPLLTDADVSKNIATANAGFYRGPEAHLIVGFFTDGDDGSDRISPGDLAQALHALKNGDEDKISTVAVVSPTRETTCPKDQGAPRGPEKIEELLRLTRSKNNLLSLCSPEFGKKLAKIGSELAVKVKRQTIDLDYIPDFSPTLAEDKKFKVFYGEQLLSPASGKNLDKGWTYDPRANSRRVIIGGDTELDYKPGAQFRIQYTPISTLNIVNGRVKAQ